MLLQGLQGIWQEGKHKMEIKTQGYILSNQYHITQAEAKNVIEFIRYFNQTGNKNAFNSKNKWRAEISKENVMIGKPRIRDNGEKTTEYTVISYRKVA